MNFINKVGKLERIAYFEKKNYFVKSLHQTSYTDLGLGDRFFMRHKEFIKLLEALYQKWNRGFAVYILYTIQSV